VADQKMERTMAGKKGASGADKGAGGGDEAAAEKKGGGKKMLLVGLLGGVLLLGGGAGGVWYFTKPAAAEPPPVAGAVIALDPISLNLADQHYLKLGLALQATATAHDAPDGSKALDLAIAEFSGLPMAELADETKREHYKDELQEKIVKAYEEEHHETVMGIYFTQFVMQ